MKRLLLLFMILWWLSSATQAATYYLNNLSTTGGNGTTSSITPSDPNRAFATLSACQTAMNTSDANGSGNTVMVYEGNGVTYGNYFESGKNRTSWITYKAADGNHPLLTTIDLPIVAGYSIDPFIVFDGFYIRPGDWWAGDGWGWRAGIRFIRANHIRLLNLDVNGCGATDQTNLLSGSRTSAINITYANDVNINNCKIYTSPRTIPRYGFSEGIAVGYSTNVEINDCNVSEGWIDIATGYNNNITIKDCNFYNPFADGFQFAGDSNLTFENNRVHHFTGVYSPTIVEDPCTTVWSADGKTMVNTSAQWATPGATYIGLGMEIVPVSGTNCLIGEGEIQVGNKLDFQVSAVDLNGMKLTLSRGIADGGQPSEVNYYIKAVTHPDMIQSGSPVFHNINIIRNQFYDWAGQAGNIKPDATTYGGSNLLVENNLFWNTYTSAAEEQSHYLNISNTTGMIFRNNTVIYNLRMWTNDNVHLNNNIISFLENYVTGENYNIFNRAPGFTVGNHSIKLQTGSGSAGYLGWNDVNFTGIFTDYNNGDFTIPGTSTLAINFGDPNNYPLTDILGNSRVFAPDAGDYEYQGGGATSDNPYLEPNIISIDFNDVAVGETAIVKVTFTNTGTLGDWNGVGTLPSPVFTFQSSGTQSETFVIHPSEVCEVNFVCTPTYGNYYIGQTAIMHQTDGNSQNIFMSFDANGIATISVTPISYIDFNSINLCIGSDQLTTKIENNADIVTNGLVTFNDSHFAVIGDANLSLGAKGIGDGNDVCNMLVGFTPDAVGSFYATAAFDVPLGYGATRSVYGSAYTILPTAATNPIPADPPIGHRALERLHA